MHTGKRKCLIFNTVPLDFIKDLKNASNVTVNDIMFTALSQAIHDYCQENNDGLIEKKGSKVQFRALMPIAFPRPQEVTNDFSQALYNKW